MGVYMWQKKCFILGHIFASWALGYIPFNPILKENGEVYQASVEGDTYVIGWVELPYGSRVRKLQGDQYSDRFLAACKPAVPLASGDNKPYVEPQTLIYVEPIVKKQGVALRAIDASKSVRTIWHSDWRSWCQQQKQNNATKSVYRGHIEDAFWLNEVIPKVGTKGLVPRKNPQKQVAMLDHAKKYYLPYMQQWALGRYDEQMFRPWLFYDVMGMTESYFQELLIQSGYTQSPDKRRKRLFPTLFDNADDQALSFFKGRTSIVNSGAFTQRSVQSLRDYFDANIRKGHHASVQPVRIIDGFKLRAGDARAHEVLLHALQSVTVEKRPGVQESQREQSLRVTDIQYLQNDSANTNAVFMVASNFNALEGGRGKFEGRLENMMFSPVQGENAALTTMAAAIQRKYLYHTSYPPKKSPQAGGINLLGGLQKNDLLEVNVDGKVEKIYKPIEQHHVGDVAIGVHEHVIPTAQFAWPYSQEQSLHELGFQSMDKEDRNRLQAMEQLGFLQPKRDPFFIYNRVIPTQLLPQQSVHQVFAAALDLGKQHNKQYLASTQQDIEAAQYMLQAAYEGTILEAARFAHQRGDSALQKVYLTLIGAGAFGNKLSWIADILENNQYIADAIRDANLEVYLVIYAGGAPDHVSSQYETIRHAVANLNSSLQLHAVDVRETLEQVYTSLTRLYNAVKGVSST